MLVGLGTGSTAKYAIEGLGKALSGGRLSDVRAVVTSEASGELATSLGIAVLEFTGQKLDLAIDGMDEVDPHLNVIKGLGGALTREKIVETCAERLILVGDVTKRVAYLGEHAPIPVEVVVFGWQATAQHLAQLGCRPLRREQSGKTFVTDNGNYVLDCHFDKPKRCIRAGRRLRRSARRGRAWFILRHGYPRLHRHRRRSFDPDETHCHRTHCENDSMIVAVGIDIVELKRIKDIWQRHPERLLYRHFTPEEILYCRAKADPLPSNRRALRGQRSVSKVLVREPRLARRVGGDGRRQTQTPLRRSHSRGNDAARFDGALKPHQRAQLRGGGRGARGANANPRLTHVTQAAARTEQGPSRYQSRRRNRVSRVKLYS